MMCYVEMVANYMVSQHKQLLWLSLMQTTVVRYIAMRFILVFRKYHLILTEN